MEPTTLQEAILYFADPVNCREYIVARRWPDGVECPRCGSKNVLFLEKYNRWHCREKHEAPQFTLKTGTVMEDSPIGLDKWLVATWLIVNCKNGISSWELHRALKVTQKSAWFMLHRIRLGLGQEPEGKMGGSGGPIEADEAYIGGNAKNKHGYRKTKRSKFIKDETTGKYVPNPAWATNRGRGTEKVAVMGMLDREAREVRAQVIPSVDRKVLQDMILENITKGSTVYTDSFGSYTNLKALDFVHETVNHAVEYVRGEVHTNSLENFWSTLKRSLRGTYISTEPFHLDKYLAEQCFRYNNRSTRNRSMTDGDRLSLAVSQIIGKRLTYAELTGKEVAY